MIPASAYATGPDPYYFTAAAMRGNTAAIDQAFHPVASGIVPAAAAALVKPGRAVFFTSPYTQTAMKSVTPIPYVREAFAAAVAGGFAGVLANDMWQTRSELVVSHIAAAPADVTVIAPNSLQPRAVDGEWWVEVDTIVGISVNTPVTILTAAGPNLGVFSPAGGLALPATTAVFTGRTATIQGINFAVIRFVSRLSD